MSDLVRTIAFAFRRKGLDAIPGGDLRLLLAYDLRWFAPEDAKRVVMRAVDAGLLREENGALRATFDTRAVEIPLNFRPTIDVLDAPIAHPAPSPSSSSSSSNLALPSPSSAPPPLDARERAAEEERRKRGLRLSLDVARLVVRRRAGEDVAADAAALEARMLTRGP